MADKNKFDDDFHGSFQDIGIGIGQTADGSIATFPLSELAERTAARDRDEAAAQYAIDQSEKGFPDEDGAAELDDKADTTG